jgi:hypothetical protein
MIVREYLLEAWSVNNNNAIASNEVVSKQKGGIADQRECICIPPCPFIGKIDVCVIFELEIYINI